MIYNDYQLCAFAFLDILGSKSKVERIIDDYQKVEKYICALTRIVEGSKETLSSYDAIKLQYQIFSDSIIIWIALGEDKNRTDKYSYDYISQCYTAISAICMAVSSIQRRGIYDEFIFRGAITVGYHYYRNHVMFSPALVRAYLAESQKSLFPRVILVTDDENDILKAVLDSLLSSGYVANDDLPFVDYLNTLYGGSFFDEFTISDFLSRHKKLIENGLNRFREKDSILIKYDWLSYYHNRRLRNGYEQFTIVQDE